MSDDIHVLLVQTPTPGPNAVPGVSAEVKVMQCPRCGEWAVENNRDHWKTCINCGWTRPIEWPKNIFRDNRDNPELVKFLGTLEAEMGATAGLRGMGQLLERSPPKSKGGKSL